MLTINEIKAGTKIELEGEPYEVLSSKFTKYAQARPNLNTKIRNLITGKVRSFTFQQSDRIEEADLKRSKAQFLYQVKGNYFFMDLNTYEQFSLSEKLIGEQKKYLKEGLEIDILLFKKRPCHLELPIKIDLKVTSAPPGIRGDTAQGATKEVELETGAKVTVPLFIKEGDLIRIDTRTGSYVEKVK